MGLFKKGTTTKDSKADDGIAWPQVNSLVWVRLPCCESAIHPSRVESIERDRLVIAHPSKPHLDPVPPPNAEKIFLIGWREGNASTQVRVAVEAVATEPVPTWTLHAQSPAEVVQRRRFVRVEYDAEINLYLPMETVVGTILDFSEAGVRCQIPKTNEPRSPFFEVSFAIEDEPTVFNAEVAWWGEPVNDNCTVGLQLVHQTQTRADRLRQFAFAQQLKQRKRS